MASSIAVNKPAHQYPTTHLHIHRSTLQYNPKKNAFETTMNTDSSSSGNRRGNQPEVEDLDAIPDDRELTSEIPWEGERDDYETLYELNELAEEARDRIERLMVEVPGLAAACEATLAQEMGEVEQAYFRGIGSSDPTYAYMSIRESISQMDSFAQWVRDRTFASGTGNRRASANPGHPPPMMDGALPSSSPAETSSPKSARGQPQQQQQPRTEEIPPRDRRVIPPEHYIIHDEGPIPVIPPCPARRVSLGETPINPPSPTGQRVRRAPTLETVAGALKRSPGESKREKLKDLWRRARDRLGQSRS
ncbi:hypothetical protein L873DRAFT_1792843 [Choiromyces venosus 120613-1]|uniref:Uncharacterized protein n=1 Tax=Choiromyces venosus 120613-1 TaxID=1336337 RepID=A0A3N4JD24_9PEZI|nr:hypothetical protein L873DRAFT_1792843 [Choiromyces venosus 120613-1]